MNAEAVRITHEIIEKKRRGWTNEEEVRVAWVRALENGLDIDLHAERDHKDLSYNNVIIEFKSPGSFRGRRDSLKFREATSDRLLPYILAESARSSISPEDYIGIAIDGDHVCFGQVLGSELHMEHMIPFSIYSTELVIAAIQADTRRPVTSENLLEDFGHGSSTAQNLMQSLSDGLADALDANGDSRIAMLYEEWKSLYGQVADMSAMQVAAVTREISFQWKGQSSQAVPARLFVIHTYNSLLVKLLAAEIVSAHGLTALKQPAQEMASIQSNDDLVRTLEQSIELSGIFADAGIRGFVEETIFSWYLDLFKGAYDSRELMSSLRSLLAQLSLYRTDRLEHSRDVLRDVYQGLVPGKLRQSLGEYYTPDWLVDFTIEAADFDSWLSGRILDPTCGSGSFLVAALRRKKEEAKLAGWTSEETIDHLCNSVWGIDLNPLAVQIARVNYLMEIADLLRDCPGEEFEIPVLLGDAIYSPAIGDRTPSSIVEYDFGSQHAKLKIEIPTDLVLNRRRLDNVFQLMDEQVSASVEFDSVMDLLLRSNILTLEELSVWRAPLERTYNRVLSLHLRNWNGIWFRMARNYFWSATAGEFDLVIGNPPWVRWSKLPEAYRDRVKPTCESYGIFSDSGRHGGNELDVSAMVTYAVADKWLMKGGRLAFVITGALFKNPSSSGFRNFVIRPSDVGSCHLAPIRVDDFKAIRPFKDAANHTVVAVFDKATGPVSYPVPYVEWSKPPRSSMAASISLPEAMAHMSSQPLEASPVDPERAGSPWSILSPGRREVMTFLEGKCDWVAGRKGITTDLNGVYFVPILDVGDDSVQIASRPEAGKRDIGAARRGWVEPSLLYPLIKGAGDFEPYYLKLRSPDYTGQKLYTFLPNLGIQDADYRLSESEMNSPGLVKTKRWFAHYREVLLSRSTYKRQMKGAPFYDVYNVGEYTLKPWKVIWPEMATNFYAAVAGSATVPLLGDRPYVPDHKIYFAAFDRKEEAYYLCGLLNSSVVREWIQSHIVSIQIGDIFKHLSVPKFDPDSQQHMNLAALVMSAHQEHSPTARRIIIPRIEAVADEVLLYSAVKA